MEDQEKLKAALPPEYVIDFNAEKKVMDGLFGHMEGVREDIDYKVVANLIKIMALSMMERKNFIKMLWKELWSKCIICYSPVFLKRT